MSSTSAIAFGDHVQSLDAGRLDLGMEGRRLRRDLLDAIGELRGCGLLSNGRSANASVRLTDTPDQVLVTARGMPANIGEEDFGVVTLGGDFVGGKLGRGVRSVVSMHTHAYRRAHVGAVIHTHSVNAAAFAVAHKPIPLHYEPLLTRGQKVPVPVCPFGDRNGGGLANQLDNFLDAHPDTHSILLGNHGLLVFDDTPETAARLAITIDEAAAIFIRAQSLGGSQPMQADRG